SASLHYGWSYLDRPTASTSPRIVADARPVDKAGLLEQQQEGLANDVLKGLRQGIGTMCMVSAVGEGRRYGCERPCDPGTECRMYRRRFGHRSASAVGARTPSQLRLLKGQAFTRNPCTCPGSEPACAVRLGGRDRRAPSCT